MTTKFIVCKCLLALGIILFLCLTNFAQEPEWHLRLKQIKPLESSRSDVERLFNSAKVEKSFVAEGIEVVFYQTPEGEFTVEYSTGKCSTGSSIIYDIENGRVLEIIFFANKRIKLGQFNVGRSKLYKTRDGDDPAWHYVNEELGVDYTTQRGKVAHVKFYPSKSKENLKCRR